MGIPRITFTFTFSTVLNLIIMAEIDKSYILNIKSCPILWVLFWLSGTRKSGLRDLVSKIFSRAIGAHRFGLRPHGRPPLIKSLETPLSVHFRLY
jgi:hypothetical protein